MLDRTLSEKRRELRPESMKKAVLSEGYYETPNPYVNAPSCHVNLLELSRYARKKERNWQIYLKMRLISF